MTPLAMHAVAFSGLMLWAAAVFTAAARSGSRIERRRFTIPPVAVLVAGAIAGAAAWSAQAGSVAPAAACIALLAAGAVDARTGYLVDAVTLPSAIVVLALAIAGGTTSDALAAVLGELVIFGGIYLVSGGRALGLGDVKALYSLAAAFGPFGTALALLSATLSGLALALARGGLQRDRAVRFGPHLAAGAALAFFTTRI